MRVTSCGEKGESFDPNFHNAVLHVDDETMGENEIAEVLMCGYKMVLLLPTARQLLTLPALTPLNVALAHVTRP